MGIELVISSNEVYIETVEVDIEIEQIFGCGEDLEHIKGTIRNLRRKNGDFVADFYIDESHTYFNTHTIKVAFEHGFDFPFSLETFNNEDAAIEVAISLLSSEIWDYKGVDHELNLTFLIKEMWLL